MKKTFLILLTTGSVCVSACDYTGKDGNNLVQKKIFLTISMPGFKKKLDANNFVLIDVRTEIEHETENIPGSQFIDFYEKDFKKKLNVLNKKQKYLIYCHSGARTSIALRLMERLGFKEVYELKGGITAWKSSGFKVIRKVNKY